MGRAPLFVKIVTGDEKIDRLQDRLVSTFSTITTNPVLAAADFRWIEVAGVAGAAPTFALQYRTPGTQTWTAVTSFSSTAGASGGGGIVGTTLAVEVPSGTVNGTTGTDGNPTFILAHTPSAFVGFLVNGAMETLTTMYTRSGTTITTVAGFIPLTGDRLLAIYFY